MKFFVSYSSADRRWAEWIAWELEAAGHAAVIQAWDFHAGENFILNMQNAAAGTEHTIAVLSEDYLASAYSSPEWAAAMARDPTGAQRTLIPVRVRPCHLIGLLSQVIYIDLVGLDPTAARNTLLNGLRAGRAKPLQAPDFPGAGTDSGNPLVFPGSAPVSTIADGNRMTAATARCEEKSADIHVSIQCPHTVLGLDSMPIHFRFSAETAGTAARVVFTQTDFVICDPEGGIADEFHFEFPKAEAYDKVLQIQAKESKDSKHVIAILCEDQNGRVLSRNSYLIRVTEPPVWWKFAEGLRATLSWGTSGGLGRLAVLLVLLIAGGLYLAKSPVGRSLVGWFSAPVPEDLLRPNHGDKWGDDFSDQAASLAKWQLEPPKGDFFSTARYLQLIGPAAAYTQEGLGRGAFFNFDMSFTATFLQGDTLEWVVRASPLPVAAGGPKRAYQFVLSAHKVSGGVQYNLDAQDCPGSGLFKCQHLVAVPADWFDDCSQPRQLHFVMRVNGPDITVAGEAIAPQAPGCHKMTPFRARHYTGLSPGTEARYGAVGFLAPAGQKVALQLVSIYSLDQSTEAYFETRR